ncbi:MAG: DUF5916 domain-containing protein [Vicinamibacterales bacterium]
MGITWSAATAFAADDPTTKIDYATARLERRLEAVRAAGPIAIDGALDEPAWSEAPLASNFIQNDPREGVAASFDTEVRVLYDDEALYIGVFARDDEPGAIIVTDLKKDFNTGNSDGFTVILDTFRDERNGYMFSTNPAGAKFDSQVSNEGRENNTNWDGIWEVKTRITERGWFAEIRIPFRTVKFTSGDPQTWGINFRRKVRRLNEDSFWSPVPRIYDIERVSLAGTVDGMQGLRPGKNIRVKPYALGSANTVPGRTLDDYDVGLDVKYGVTSGLTWDFTVNTDFSQVEADEQQINLSRFNLFFPEKRDVFLENSGIFQFGASDRMGGGGGGGRQNAAADMLLFHSRRIGLSENGDAIPILAGTRLTGRQGRYSVGVLNIQQREYESDQGVITPSTNFMALRMRRDILSNSDIGAVFLNKDERGARYNRIAGVDANFRFGFLSLNGYVAKALSPQVVEPGTGGDTAVRGSFNYQSRVWQFRGHFNGIGERFTSEMGFVPRQGVNNVLLYTGYTWRPSWFRKLGLRETRPHWQMDLYERQHGAGLESRYQDWHWPFNFNDGTFVEIGVNSNVEEIREPFTINSSRGVRVLPGRYDFNEYFVLWRGNTSAPFSFEARYSNGEFYDGYRRGYTIGPTIRPNEKFNASVSLQINDIELAEGAFVSTLVTSRLNYNFSTTMFVNALLQYNTDSRQWSSNLRFNIIHRPLSDFFFVYNERRDERSGSLINRALVAKMTYLVAF